MCCRHWHFRRWLATSGSLHLFYRRSVIEIGIVVKDKTEGVPHLMRDGNWGTDGGFPFFVIAKNPSLISQMPAPLA
jgi:hypothetical protein